MSIIEKRSMRKIGLAFCLNQDQAKKISFYISLNNNTYGITILIIVRKDPEQLTC